MASNVAIISDIRGLVTQGEDGEEILKNKDPISENGGLLTITEFAKIIFDDGREIEIDGPTQIRLDSTFFENAAFIPQETIVNIETLPFLRTIAPTTTEEEAPQSGLDAQNDARGGVITEQLDTARTQEAPEVRELEAGREDETVAQVAQTEEPEGAPAQEPTPDVPEEDEGADQQNVTISLAGSATVIEGESATYTISTSMPTYTDLTLTVSYQTLDASTGDFITHTQSVLIKAGETSATFVVDAVDDFYSDNGEKYQVTISNPVGGFRDYDIVTISNASVTTEILDGTQEADNGIGAADTVIQCHKDGDTHRAVIEKQKDGQDNILLPFALDQVELGEDEDGEPITSCVVVHDHEGKARPLSGSV